MIDVVVGLFVCVVLWCVLLCYNIIVIIWYVVVVYFSMFGLLCVRVSVLMFDFSVIFIYIVDVCSDSVIGDILGVRWIRCVVCVGLKF